MSDSPRSLFGSFQRLADLAVGMVQTRVELFVVELEEEKCRFIHMLLLAAAAMALGVTALTLTTITIVLIFWEEGRIPALCVLSALFIIGTVLVLRTLDTRLKSRGAFEGTLGELKKDRECLRSND